MAKNSAKSSEKKGTRSRKVRDLPPTRQEQDRVKGGIASQRTPLPGGPVPIPYPDALK